MKPSLLLTSVSLFVTFTANIFAATPLVNLVDENAPLVVSINDVPKMVKNWEGSPWSKTWNDEQMKKFLAPFRSQMKVDQWSDECKAATGYTLAELIEFATGEAMIALTNADFPIDGEQDRDKRPVLLALEVGDNAGKIEKLIAENDEKKHAISRIEEFSGVKLHVYAVSEKDATADYSWAMVDGVWLFSLSKTELTKTVDALKNGRMAAPLGGSERFLRVKKETGDANVTVLVNIQSLQPLLKTALEAKAKQSGSNTLGLPPETLLSVLGIDALRDLYLGVAMGEGATDFVGGLTYSECKGFLKILAYQDGPAPRPEFVSAKWITATTARFSLFEAYTAIRSLAEGLNPILAGMVQPQIKNLNQQLGIDIERDLLGSLGNELIVANAMRPGATADTPTPLSEFEQLYAISLKNPTAFTNAVDALKRMAGPQAEKLFVKREYLGHAIYTYEKEGTPAGQKGFCYAITPQYVFVAVGTSAVIETALQGLSGKQPTLWQLPEVKEALADVPEKAMTIEYQNTRAMIGGMIETFAQMASMFAARQQAAAGDEDEGEGEDEPVGTAKNDLSLDPSAKPDAATIAKYWSTASGYAWRDSQGLYFHSKLNHVK
ncbi:MAG: hypothetical protein IPP19_10695 [Verrucomicrobia bacterium]|nr:hypothetical protein [Verrucomicrobiota bacterium]